MSSRVIVSTTISAVLVLISYLWYRRRVRRSVANSENSKLAAGAESTCSSALTPDAHESVRNETCTNQDKLTLSTDAPTNQLQVVICDVPQQSQVVNCDPPKQEEQTVNPQEEQTVNCSCPTFKKKKMGKKKRNNMFQQNFDPDIPNKASLARARLLGRNLMTYSASVPQVRSYSEKTRKVSVSELTDEFSDIRVSDSAVDEGSDNRPRSDLQKCSISSSSDMDAPKLNCASSLDSASHSPAEEMLASNCVSDSQSEGSSDSGKGGSDVPSTDLATSPSPPAYLIYEFEMPQKLCPRLIGRYGTFIQEIKAKSGATVLVKQHPTLDTKRKLVAVEGTQTEVDAALQLIRQRFPLKKFSAVTLEPWIKSVASISVPDMMLLTLPQDVSCDVIVSSLVSPGHVFLQQPTHPSFPALQHLEYCMNSCYTLHETPILPGNVELGVICAAPVLESWYRAQVVSFISGTDEGSDEVDVKFLDHGGYSRMKVSELRQIRSDFMALAFQAVECYLANVAPNPEDGGWTLEAMAALEEMVRGVVLQAQVSHYSEEGIPSVHLHRFTGAQGNHINRELVNRGLAQWVEVTEA